MRIPVAARPFLQVTTISCLWIAACGGQVGTEGSTTRGGAGEQSGTGADQTGGAGGASGTGGSSTAGGSSLGGSNDGGNPNTDDAGQGGCRTPCRATCGAGTHMESSDDQCCGTCVPDDAKTKCDDGKRRYQAQREQLIAVYSGASCEINGCTTAYESNLCVQTCGISMSSSWAEAYIDKLKSFAESACSTCPPIPAPPCAFPGTPICTAMGCQFTD
jgi:hypothetical protein